MDVESQRRRRFGGAGVRIHGFLRAFLATPGGPLNRVTKQVTIHSLTVPQDMKEPVVSFHVYSLPFDSCVVFDVAQGHCSRKELAFDYAPEGYTVRMR